MSSLSLQAAAVGKLLTAQAQQLEEQITHVTNSTAIGTDMVNQNHTVNQTHTMPGAMGDQLLQQGGDQCSVAPHTLEALAWQQFTVLRSLEQLKC